MSTPTIYTVGELIAALQALGVPNAPVGALAPSSMTAYPLWMSLRNEGTPRVCVELIGDEQGSRPLDC